MRHLSQFEHVLVRQFTLLTVLIVLTLTACTTPAPTSTAPAPTPASGWPRQVESAGGTVTISARPERIHALSLGYEEILFALLPVERFAATSTFAVDPTLSNVVPLAKQIGRTVGREAESILASNPDLVVASATSRPELVERLRAAGVPVVVSTWRDTIEALPRTIRWLASITGSEDSGERLISEVDRRLARIDRLVSTKPESERPPSVLLEDLNLFVAGRGSTRDALLRRAGGRNLAAESGVEGDKAVGLESLVALNPSVLVVQDDPNNPRMLDQVRQNPALVDLPAIRSGKVFLIERRYLASLSHWKVRGVEEIAKRFWPELAGEQFRDFQ